MLAACESPLSPSELVGVDQGERLWAARGYTDYTIETRLECFCPPSLRDWAMIEVVSGRVRRVVLLTTLAVITDERLPWWRTVEEIFGDLHRANIENGGWLKDVQLSLDPVLGYPTTISWLSKPKVQDAGLVQYFRNPQQLLPPPS